MNYLFLKNIMSSILGNFTCPECNNTPDEDSFDLKSVTDREIDIHFACKHCKSKALMKAELGQLAGGFLSTEAGKDFLKKAIAEKKIIVADVRNPGKKPSPKNGISDSEISQIEEKLAKNPTINDLINGE